MTTEDHHTAIIVTPTKSPWPSFFTLSNISKDTEFQGLSETRVVFFGAPRHGKIRGELLVK
jgi:hypothetical protein